MENSQVMHFVYKEVCIDKAANYWYCLDKHYELSELEGPIKFRRHHLEVSNHYAIAYTIADTQHQHSEIPLKLIVSVVGELKD